MQEPELFMVFDVESVGLHGEGFAVGWVVVDRAGKELGEGRSDCYPERARGGRDGRDWVAANVPHRYCLDRYTPAHVRDAFWSSWLEWKAKGATLAAECPWPVEARFLAACVDDAIPSVCGERPDDGPRGWDGPYPLVDVSSVRLAAGFNPVGIFERLPSELPAHDPVADARQSARLLIEALDRAECPDRR
jgi:hypothetical protein